MAGYDWPGFQPTDFGQVLGTSWRRRNDPGALVPLLLRPLLQVDSDFSTYPLYGLPEIHFAAKDRYEQGSEHGQGWRASKLVIYANDDPRGRGRQGRGAHVVVGYWIELGTGKDEFGPVDRALWDWPRLIEFLRSPARRRSLELAFERHPLAIGDYFGGSFTGAGLVGFVGRIEEGELVVRDARDKVIGRGWDAAVARLPDKPTGEWKSLHIWREWPAEEAIAAGHPFATRSMLPVMLDLAAVYEDVVRYSSGTRS